ncbi:hypothetical protein HID58_086624 [Brassica napus]|uniref:Sulfotransferase domain-containing protein n=1 Tax=Brassica napus TaxID=3708 RepID=A0ABQ7XR43_BRANA|nr:hypothetical protein HID58_086624 [Brassica napus]
MWSCSSAFQRVASLMFMAPKLKPQRLHQKTGAEQLVKKARTMTTESSMKDAFSQYADYLNNFNEKRERVVKASRDITMNSKKVIFQVHRLSKDNKEEVLEKAGKDLEAVREQHFARLMKELQGTDFWKLRRAYSPGVQEYVEAATFYKFCVSGTLSTLDEINSTLLPLSDPSLEPLQINILDYILGLADLTGELMRMAIGRISDGEVEFAQRICQFVRQIHRELLLVVPQMDDSYDMKSKMEVMLQSVIKIENACFSVHVRGSEYIPLLGDDAPTSFLLGETRDLISSLPSEKGWLVSQIYQFQGRWHTEALLQGILTCQKHFKAKDSDIILVTNPKSGTTWLKSLVFALINRHKFPVSSGDHPLLVTNPHLLVPFMEGVYYESPDFDFSLLPFPRLMNTHISHLSLPESVKSSSCQIVYCCRNPKDMFVSLWHFGKKLAPQETADYPLEKAVEAEVYCLTILGSCVGVLVCEPRESEQGLELKKQTEVEVKRIAEFIGCGFTAEEEVSEIVKLCSFESLSRLEVNRQGKLPNGIETNAFFRKGEIGGWRDTLSESLADAIDRTTEEKIKRVLAAEELSKQRTLRSLCCKTFKYEWQNKRNPKDVFVLLWYFMKSLILKEIIMCDNIENIVDPSLMKPPPMNFVKSPISLNVSSDEQLKAGRCRQRVVTRLLRFWKARNAKKDEKLMGVDLLLLDRKIPSNLIQATINVHRLKTFRLWFSLYSGIFHHSSLVLRCASAASSSSNAATAKAPKPSGCNIRAASSSNSTSDREAICSIRLKKMIPLQVEELRGQGAEQYAYKWEKATVQISSTRCTNDDDSCEVTLDEDFLTALEYGMPPPASGMAGDAVDKLCEYKRHHCVSCSEGSAVIIAPNVSSGIKPNIRTFNILLDSYGKKGKYKKMSAVIEFMNIVIYNMNPNPNPDIRRILQFLEEYPTSGYPRTPDPDKDSKIMDPPDKDPDLDTLKLPGYPIRLRPIINTGHY